MFDWKSNAIVYNMKGKQRLWGCYPPLRQRTEYKFLCLRGDTRRHQWEQEGSETRKRRKPMQHVLLNQLPSINSSGKHKVSTNLLYQKHLMQRVQELGPPGLGWYLCFVVPGTNLFPSPSKISFIQFPRPLTSLQSLVALNLYDHIPSVMISPM